METLREILHENATYLVGELKRMIIKKKIKGNDLLSGSISASVEANEDAWTGRMDFIFRDEGRFVDMGAGRGSKIESIASNGDLIARRFRNPKKWYSKTAYGIIYGRLIDKLVEHAQERTLEELKGSLTQQNSVG